jgi:hypothetical protein
VRDERSRKCYRVRKHDIEEFSDVVARYGTYKRDLEMFAAALFDDAPVQPQASPLILPPIERDGVRLYHGDCVDVMRRCRPARSTPS